MATSLTYPVDLVSLDQVKAHLRLTGITLPAADSDLLELYVLHATATVIDYIARPDDDWIAEIEAWTDETVPPAVQAAILLQVAELYRFRGDEDAPKRENGFLAPQIVTFLCRYRDPAVS